VIGEAIMNPEFFDMLYADSAFCEALGRMTLAAGRFESTLREYLRLRGVIVPDQASFGPLLLQHLRSTAC
jgi:hypothetical protein